MISRADEICRLTASRMWYWSDKVVRTYDDLLSEIRMQMEWMYETGERLPIPDKEEIRRTCSDLMLARDPSARLMAILAMYNIRFFECPSIGKIAQMILHNEFGELYSWRTKKPNGIKLPLGHIASIYLAQSLFDGNPALRKENAALIEYLSIIFSSDFYYYDDAREVYSIEVLKDKIEIMIRVLESDNINAMRQQILKQADLVRRRSTLPSEIIIRNRLYSGAPPHILTNLNKIIDYLYSSSLKEDARNRIICWLESLARQGYFPLDSLRETVTKSQMEHGIFYAPATS